MKKGLLILLVLIGFTLFGCSNGIISGDHPPEVKINIGNENYETVLGTYCWNNECAETGGPIELLRDKKPIEVSPGEQVSLVMDYEPKPNKFHLNIVNEDHKSEVSIEESNFKAPNQKGIYYYDYGVWWVDEKKEHLSHGDAFYAFVLEVK